MLPTILFVAGALVPSRHAVGWVRPHAPAIRAPQVHLSVTEPSDDRPTSRALVAVFATCGAVETGFLTANKLWNVGALDGVCGAGGGCSDVLSGPWSSIAGVPLSLLGFVAYTAVASLAAVPLFAGAAGAQGDEGEDQQVAAFGEGALAFGAGALASFSACLLLLLQLVIHQSCVLCYGSAALSASILAATWSTPLRRTSETEKAVYTACGALVSLAAAATLYFVAAPQQQQQPGESLGSTSPSPVRSRSSARALDVATRLQSRGARVYGAYWCSHCAGQKETLGAAAAKLVPYIECDAEGENSRRALCQEAGVRGYPTWELDGKLFPGERSIDELEALLAGDAADPE
jgi:uncharacterized membrane protein/glutaredoxin